MYSVSYLGGKLAVAQPIQKFQPYSSTLIHVTACECPQISKTKAPLLRKWLQENGVKCSKEKKDSLIRYAALHIKETGRPFEIQT